ncbi:hypothetical protein [Hymenobacter sediminicola]|uniref:Outer membrane protein assembly factor BamE n=1 Tax=Hymenobacter sediminicola TaxID=2761579 RepID=A0A7G7W4F2_9BACT|nr:hypothetical protein [Hymenobacter sediminicola]QNH61245.1 hypothetical protein H4317_13860 [Hymenobacter sediminicola]
MDIIVFLVFATLVLSVFSFFAWRWLISKIASKGVHKNAFSVFMVICTAPVTFFFVMYLYLLSSVFYGKYDFDSNEWLKNPEKRYEMTTNMIESKVLIGKSKEEVSRLLGNERRLEWTKDGLDCWQYYIGDKPTFGMDLDPDAIDVYFKNGKAVRVYEHET